MTHREKLAKRIIELREDYKRETDPRRKQIIIGLGKCAVRLYGALYPTPLVKQAEAIFKDVDNKTSES